MSVTVWAVLEASEISHLPNSPKAHTAEKGGQLKVAASFPFSEIRHTIAQGGDCICR